MMKKAQLSTGERQASRVIFIGNISYDATEEQLVQICGEVGQVVNFRMVYDNKTHKKKGYAFCEYVDESSAASAKRNLNDRDLNGRKLRVDFADNNQINIPADEREKSMMGNQQPHHSDLVNMPNPNQDPIIAALQQIPRAQLFSAAAAMKQLVQSNTEKSRQILTQYPTLAIIMLDIQYLLGMTNQPWTPEVSVSKNMMAPNPMMPQPMVSNINPMMMQNRPHPVGMIQQPMGGFFSAPPQFIPPQLAMNVQAQLQRQQQPPYVMPQPQPQPQPMRPMVSPQPQPTIPQPQPQQPPSSIPPQQLTPQLRQQVQQILEQMTKENVQQILSLTDQQIEALPAESKQQIVTLRHNLQMYFAEQQHK